MGKGKAHTNRAKSQISFVMTADDAERYAPPADMDPGAVLQEKGLHGEEAARLAAEDERHKGEEKLRS